MSEEMTINAVLIKAAAATARQKVISEIQAFANDYHHHIDGRDVVIVEQLLAFLESPNGNEG